MNKDKLEREIKIRNKADPINDYAIWSSKYLDTNEYAKESLEENTIIENLIIKRATASDDINLFLNSLNDTEFKFYMSAEKEIKDRINLTATQLSSMKNKDQKSINDNDIMNTGRDDTFYSWSLNQRILKIKEDYGSLEKKEDQLSDQEKIGEELQEYLDILKEQNDNNFEVFRPCSFYEFYQIFQVDCFNELPLFVKLYFLKELMQFNTLYEDRAFLAITSLLLFCNTSYYYVSRYIFYSNKVKLVSIVRFILMFLTFDLTYREIIKAYYVNNHYVDLNPIFNCDEFFLYSNPYYRALLKRLMLFPQIINDNYDFSEIEGEKNEIYEKYCAHRLTYSYDPSCVVGVYNKVFAVKQNSSLFRPTFRAFDRMMEKYIKYFNKQKEEFKHEIEHYYADKFSLNTINIFVDYYDKLKGNKLSMKMGTIENLPFKEHDFNHAVDNMLETITEIYEGLEIKKEMSLDEKIDILRNFHNFK